MDWELLPSAYRARTHIDEDTGCWVWTGSKTQKGYGRFGHRLAHRTSYELLVGPIPEGLVIDHLCRNRGCINPVHLEVVTNRENVMRGDGPRLLAAKNRERSESITHCPHGHVYDEANTYWSPRKKRYCRACQRQRDVRRRAALRGGGKAGTRPVA
jgi:hypothetical protein